MSPQITFDQTTDIEKIKNGNVSQIIHIYNPERIQQLKSGKLLSIYHQDTFLFHAILDGLFTVRFYKRITPLPFVTGENRYMTREELQDIVRRSGYKDQTAFYFAMSKLYGKYLQKETFVVVRFTKTESENNES